MRQRNNAARATPIVSRDRVIETVRGFLHTAIHVERRFTAGGIAEQAGVELRAIQSYMSSADPRECSLSSALSIAVVVGPRAVNSILALIGYTGSPIEDADAPSPTEIVAEGLAHFAVIAAAAADNRFDHQEAPAVERAADELIEILTPVSSHRRAE